MTRIDSDPEVFHYLRLHAELDQLQVATRTMDFESLTVADFKGVTS